MAKAYKARGKVTKAVKRSPARNRKLTKSNRRKK